MSNDTFLIHRDNLTYVLSEFMKTFKGKPLDYISMDAIVTLFEAEFALNDVNKYQITKDDMMNFMDKINGIYVDRLMIAMDKKGLAQLGHDGNEFFLIANKKS